MAQKQCGVHCLKRAVIHATRIRKQRPLEILTGHTKRKAVRETTITRKDFLSGTSLDKCHIRIGGGGREGGIKYIFKSSSIILSHSVSSNVPMSAKL